MDQRALVLRDVAGAVQRFTGEKRLVALNIRNPEAERLAAELARITGETKTAAVTRALRDRLARVRRDNDTLGLADRLVAIGRECAALPVLDERSADEILGYSADRPSTESG